VLYASFCDLILSAHLNGKKTLFTILKTAIIPIYGPLELMQLRYVMKGFFVRSTPSLGYLAVLDI
jgi:hypothetical protein